MNDADHRGDLSAPGGTGGSSSLPTTQEAHSGHAPTDNGEAVCFPEAPLIVRRARECRPVIYNIVIPALVVQPRHCSIARPEKGLLLLDILKVRDRDRGLGRDEDGRVTWGGSDASRAGGQ